MPKVTGKGGKQVSKTGTRATSNVAGGAGPSQTNNTLVKAGGVGLSSAGAKKKKAKSKKTKDKKKGDPVSVISGQVVREARDLEMRGPIPVEWKRLYSSGNRDEVTALGRGGWSHALEQWVAVEDGEVTLRGEDGKSVVLPSLVQGELGYSRGERLAVRRGDADRWEVTSLETRITRVFTPLSKGGRSVLRELTDPWGNRVELAYASARLVAVRGAGGRELRVSYDEDGRVARVDAWADGASRQSVTYAYTHDGELARAADASGHAETYAYDALHRMARCTLKNGVPFFYAYDDELDRCVHTWGGPDGDLYDVEFTYDMNARTTVAADLEPRKYTWNERGALLREETPDGEWAVEYEYDQDLLCVAERNAAGEEWRWEHDEHGNVIRETDPAGNVTRWDYKDDLVVRRISPDGHTTEVRRDARGLPTEVRHPTGLRWQLAYDGAGRVSYVSGGDETRASYEYDEKGDLLREVDARGAATTYTYDALGRPLTRTDALGRVTRIAYDAVGRPKAITRPDGGRTEVVYDAMGNVVRHVDPTGRVTLSEYGGTGVLVARTMADGQVWRFEYDGIERLTRITNPKRETFTFEHDRVGRVVSERTFDGRALKYAYSKADRLRRVEAPDGTWREMAYDPLGNLVKEDSSHGPRVFTRDPLGRLQEATVVEHNGKTVVKFERDRFGRILAEIQNGMAVRSSYDARGRRVERVLPAGETTRWAYDRAGAPERIEHGGQTVTIERDALGRETARRFGRGGVEVTSAWDAGNRLEKRVARAVSRAGEAAHRVLSQRRWSYDLAGRVTGVDDARWGASRFRYDATGELIEAHRGARHELFHYDGGMSLVGAFESLSEAAGDWTMREGGLLARAADTEYAYDAGARRAKETRAGAVTTYLWDCRDQLREIELPDGARVLYTYDALGRRVRKEVVPAEPSEVTTAEPARVRVVQFLWDGDALAQEIDTDRGKRVFVHTPSLEPVLQQEQGEVYAYVVDHLGTTKELVDESGQVAWSAAHSAWGLVTESTRTDPARAIESPFRLLGQYHDEETGLAYARFRYFDAPHGRWLSPDPIGLYGGENLFAFNGAPTHESDPLGLMPYPTVDFTGSPDLYPAGPGQSSIVTITMQGKRRWDFDEANEAGNFDSKPDGYTWHHVADFDPDTGKCTMQLVRTDAHEATFPHEGSAAQFGRKFGVKYDSPEAAAVAEKKGWLANRRRKCPPE